MPLVSYLEWLHELEQAESTLSTTNSDHPSLRLIDFYRAVAKVNVTRLEVAGAPKFSTEIARKESLVLSNPDIRRIEVEDVQKWLDFWKSVGLLSF